MTEPSERARRTGPRELGVAVTPRYRVAACDWMMLKRLSQGRFSWWPNSADAQVPLSARELIILLWNGDPERAQMARDWRRVA